jgi:hypothetical protein
MGIINIALFTRKTEGKEIEEVYVLYIFDAYIAI